VRVQSLSPPLVCSIQPKANSCRPPAGTVTCQRSTPGEVAVAPLLEPGAMVTVNSALRLTGIVW